MVGCVSACAELLLLLLLVVVWGHAQLEAELAKPTCNDLWASPAQHKGLRQCIAVQGMMLAVQDKIVARLGCDRQSHEQQNPVGHLLARSTNTSMHAQGCLRYCVFAAAAAGTGRTD
jgi:hypothetical protein